MWRRPLDLAVSNTSTFNPREFFQLLKSPNDNIQNSKMSRSSELKISTNSRSGFDHDHQRVVEQGKEVVRTGLVGMEENQVKAVKASPNIPLCVFAGPGSGKTAVIMERLKYLNSVVTTKCLVLTFSKAAVIEMTNRLKQMGDLKNIEISTFHSFCFRLILKFWSMLGYPSKPKVALRHEARKIFRVSRCFHFIFSFSNFNHPRRISLSTHLGLQSNTKLPRRTVSSQRSRL